jgi:dTMP kinase
MEKGIFIAFEGLDGSGKTTQFNAIRDKLAKRKIKCKEEKEPSDRNSIGLLVRGVVKKARGYSVDPLSLAMLFAVDRYEHVINDIKPHIDKGGHVLIDRYIFSSFAYQGLTCSYDEIYFYNKQVIGILMPDLTVFIDTDPKTSLSRINRTRVGKEIFDAEGMFVRKNFLNAIDKMKDITNILVVDGNQPDDVITDEIWKAVEPLFLYSINNKKQNK